MANEKAPLWYRYTFTFEDGAKKTFEVQLDRETLAVLHKPDPAPPEWSKLDHHKCENCPLNSETTPHCPIARNMTEVVEGFRKVISYKTADVLVECEERSIFKDKVPVQNALYSLMGIYMSASGCPVMDALKPLVRYHLPFASIDESIYRMTTMYVMAQYLRMQEGLAADWEMAGAATLFDEVHKVNVGFCLRLRNAIEEDALVNSVSILDVFASMGKARTPKRMAALKKLFAPYLEGKS